MKHTRRVNTWRGLILLALLLTLAGCQARPRTQDQVPRIAPGVLKQRIDADDDVLVVDARSADSYATQHIPGAISIPVGEVEARLDELPRDQAIVFY